MPATGESVETRFKLKAGETYSLTAAGLSTYGTPGQVGDAVCTWSRRDVAWVTEPSRAVRHRYGRLTLALDGRPAFTTGCRRSHSYRTQFTVRRSARLRLRVLGHQPSATGRLRLDPWDPLRRDDNSGCLTVRVQRLTPIPTPAPAPGERPHPRWTEYRQARDGFRVDARDPQGALSTMRLRKGESVRVVVRGTYTSSGRQADASCVRTSAGWSRTDPDVVGQDPLNVWVDGRPVRWRALDPASGCSSEFRDTARFTQTSHNGAVRVSVLDLDYRDNRGTLDVTLQRIGH